MALRGTVAEARVLLSWRDYQEALKRAVAPLSGEQLGVRPLDGRRTPGELAGHIVFGRAYHLTRVLGDAVAEVGPYLRWEGVVARGLTAGEIVEGLEVTWRVIEGQISRGAADVEISEEEAEVLRVVWGLLDHDLPHAGQLSLVLRAMGLDGVDV
jgi:hypothetical protein